MTTAAIHQTRLRDAVTFKPHPVYDNGGSFSCAFDAAAIAAAGLDPGAFVEEVQSRSSRGSIRGLHGRSGAGEAKLVRCARGAIFDVVIDARPGSPTFGEHQAFVLDDIRLMVLYVPAGFLHGFQVLSPLADVCCRVDRPQDPADDISVSYQDPELRIDWPLELTLLNARDRAAGSWSDLLRSA